MFCKISITLSLETFILYVTRSLFHIFWYLSKDAEPLTSLSTIICKLASDTLISVLLSLWSARCLLSVCKLLQYVKLFMEHTFSLIIESVHKVPFYKFFLIHLWMDISMSFYCAVNTAKIGVSSLLTSTWMAIHLC